MRYCNPGSSDRIAAAIRASGLTQREIARSLGVSDVSVSSYVSGWRKPAAGRLVRLARVLDIDVRDLMDPTDVAAGDAYLAAHRSCEFE